MYQENAEFTSKMLFSSLRFSPDLVFGFKLLQLSIMQTPNAKSGMTSESTTIVVKTLADGLSDVILMHVNSCMALLSLEQLTLLTFLD